MSNHKLTRTELESGDVTLPFLRANVLTQPVEALAYYHKLGLFRIRAVEDKDVRFEDLCGDIYNPVANPDIPAAQLIKEKKSYRARVVRQGVWGFIVEVRRSRDSKWEDCGPESVNSIWGNVGSEILGSGYDGDLLSTAIEALEKFSPEATDPTAKLVSKATKALAYLEAMELGSQAGYAKWLEIVAPLREALEQFEPKFK